MPSESLSAIVDADVSGLQQAMQQMARTVEQAAQRSAQQIQGLTKAFASVEQAVKQATQQTQTATRGLTTLGQATDGTTRKTTELAQAEKRLAEAQGLLAKVTDVVTQATQRAGVAKDTLRTKTQQATTTQQAFQRGLQGLLGPFVSVQTAAGALGAYLGGQLVRSLVQAGIQMDSLQRSFTTIAGSAEGGRRELGFVAESAQRLGLSFTTLAANYRGLAAAARGTTLEGQATRDVFTAITEASVPLGLSNEATGRALLALQQILSKGTVASEELRGQLGEALPGAFQIAARAMGVTTAELSKMLEQGRVLATDFLPKFGAQVKRELGDATEQAGKRAGAGMTRLGNTFTEVAAQIANSGFVQAIDKSAGALATFLGQLVGTESALRGWANELSRTTGRAIEDINRLSAAELEAARVAGRPDPRRPHTPDAIRARQRQIIDAAVTRRRVAEELQQAEDALFGAPALQTFDPLAFLKPLQEAQKHFEQGLPRLQSSLERAGIAPMQRLQAEVGSLRSRYGDLVKALDELTPAQEAQRATLEAQLKTVQTALSAGEKQLQAIADGIETERERIAVIRERIALEKSAASEAAQAFREEMAAITDLALTHENVNKVIAQATAEAKTALEERLDVAKETGTSEAAIASARAKALLELDTQVAKARKDLGQDVADNQRAIAEQIQDLTAGTLAKELLARDRQIEELRKRGATALQIEEFYANATVNAYRKTADETIAVLEDRGKKRLDLIEKFYERETEALDNNVARQIEALDKELAQFKGLVPDEQFYEMRMQGLVKITDKANEHVVDGLRASLDEQRKAWEEFADDVADTLSGILFHAFEGGFKDTEDALERLKRTFFRILAEITAQNLTKQFILPFVQGVAPTLFGPQQGQQAAPGQAAVGGQPAAPQLGISATAQQATAQQSNALTQALQGLLGLFKGGGRSFQNALRAVQGAPATAPGGGGALTVIGGLAGGAATAVGAGIGTFNLLAPLLQGALGETGSGGRAANAIGGGIAGGVAGGILGAAVAGAVLGSVVPVIGTIIGAVVGVIVGVVLGLLQKVAKERVVRADAIDVPRFVDDALGASLGGAFEILQVTSKHASPEQVDRFKDSIEAFINTFLFGVENFVHNLPQSVQEVIPDTLNAHLDELETSLEDELEIRVTSLKGKDLDQAIEQFLAEDLPQLVNEVFGEILERARQFADVIQGFDSAIADLEAIQETMTRNFRDQRQELEELLFTPAQTYERRRDELENVLAIFEGATSAERIALAPEIQNLISEIAQLAPNEEVLGQDLPLLIGLQEELLGILGEVEAASLEAVENQIAVATDARDALLDQIDILEATRDVFEKEMRAANITLNAIADLLEIATNPAALNLIGSARPPIEEYQTGTPFVPRTGLALLHRGEAVLSPTMASRWREGGGGSNSTYDQRITVNVDVHVNGSGAASATVIAERVAEAVGRRLESQSHYQQSRLDLRTARARELRSTQPRQTGG